MHVKIPALGRPFYLGMLYDRRSEKLIMGKTLWSQKHLNEALIINPQPYVNSDVFIENSIDDKTTALSVEAGLKLSFLCGLVNVEGSAKYLIDAKTSKQQSRVVLKYETTTEVKQLSMNHLGDGKADFPEVFSTDDATDVVVGLLYGAKAFIVFDRELSKDESLKEINGKMKALVETLPRAENRGNCPINITEEQKKTTENMRCKMYGDFLLSKAPANFEEAVKVYQELPSLIGKNGENAVPIQVYLCPLSSIDTRCKKIAREISANLVNKTSISLQNFKFVEEECNDLLHNEICYHFPQLKKQIATFLEKIELYRKDYGNKILSVLPKVRGRVGEEQELAQLIDKKNALALYLQIFRWKQKHISFVWIKLSCLCADNSTGFARVSQMVN